MKNHPGTASRCSPRGRRPWPSSTKWSSRSSAYRTSRPCAPTCERIFPPVTKSDSPPGDALGGPGAPALAGPAALDQRVVGAGAPAQWGADRRLLPRELALLGGGLRRHGRGPRPAGAPVPARGGPGPAGAARRIRGRGRNAAGGRRARTARGGGLRGRVLRGCWAASRFCRSAAA